jgi:hypothetical protein
VSLQNPIAAFASNKATRDLAKTHYPFSTMSIASPGKLDIPQQRLPF